MTNQLPATRRCQRINTGLRPPIPTEPAGTCKRGSARRGVCIVRQNSEIREARLKPKSQTTYSTEECNSTTCFRSIHNAPRPPPNPVRLRHVNYRNFNKARLRLQRLTLLHQRCKALYGIQRQRLRITQNHCDIVHAGNGLYIRHITRRCASRPDPFLASQRHRRFQFQYYRRFTIR